MYIPVLRSSWWGRESSLLCLVCLPGVSWWLCGSSSRSHGFFCGLWLWVFLIILTYCFWLIVCTGISLKYLQKFALSIERTSIWDRISFNIIFIQQHTFKYLNQQWVHIATATRTLEPSKIHKICTNKWYYYYIGTNMTIFLYNICCQIYHLYSM